MYAFFNITNKIIKVIFNLFLRKNEVEINNDFYHKNQIRMSLSKSDFSMVKSKPSRSTKSITSFLYQFSDLGWM